MLLNALTALEKLSTGGITAFIGLLMTFVMLGFLIALIYLLEFLIKNSKVWLGKLNAKKANNETDTTPLLTTTQSVVDEKRIEEGVALDENTINAINSAVEMYMEQGEDGKKHLNYTIKKITKV